MFADPERRKHYRHKFPVLVPVEFTLQSSGEETFSGFATNISAYGLCFLTSNSLESQSEIRFRDNRYIPFRTAKVLWVQSLDQRHYKIGLACDSRDIS